MRTCEDWKERKRASNMASLVRDVSLEWRGLYESFKVRETLKTWRGEGRVNGFKWKSPQFCRPTLKCWSAKHLFNIYSVSWWGDQTILNGKWGTGHCAYNFRVHWRACSCVWEPVFCSFSKHWPRASHVLILCWVLGYTGRTRYICIKNMAEWTGLITIQRDWINAGI